MNTTPRLRVLTLGLALASVVLASSACSGDDERAVDTAGTPTPAASASPTDPPPLPVGEERTEVNYVVDDGDGPVLCLGAVAESAPPQCTGVPLSGWDWADHPEQEQTGGTRWGTFGVTGTFDGEVFAVTYAAPGAGAVMPESE